MHFQSTSRALRAKSELSAKARAGPLGGASAKAAAERETYAATEAQSTTARYNCIGWNSRKVPTAPVDPESLREAASQFRIDNGVRLEAILWPYSNLPVHQQAVADAKVSRSLALAVDVHTPAVALRSRDNATPTACACSLLPLVQLLCCACSCATCDHAALARVVHSCHGRIHMGNACACVQLHAQQVVAAVMNDQVIRYTVLEAALMRHHRAYPGSNSSRQRNMLLRNVRALRSLVLQAFGSDGRAAANWRALRAFLAPVQIIPEASEPPGDLEGALGLDTALQIVDELGNTLSERDARQRAADDAAAGFMLAKVLFRARRAEEQVAQIQSDMSTGEPDGAFAQHALCFMHN
jgi:hypothetical protein